MEITAMNTQSAVGILPRLGIFLESIKFSHSVFALPFALVAMVLAAEGVPSLWTIFWIIVACVAARTAAMAFNRLVDREFDANNPRTASRPTVTGAVSPGFLLVSVLGSSLLFIFSAAMLNRTCFILSGPVLVVLFFYSLTKRFTALSHLVLGFALALAPMGAWVAVTGSIALLPAILAFAVLCWVAGFDVLYSCQDYHIDASSEKLHSIPKALGIPRAMAVARLLHVEAFVLFLLFWALSPLGFLGFLAVLGVGALLLRQHSLLAPDDLSRIDAAFFTTNGFLSLGFMVLVFVDFLLLG